MYLVINSELKIPGKHMRSYCTSQKVSIHPYTVHPGILGLLHRLRIWCVRKCSLVTVHFHCNITSWQVADNWCSSVAWQWGQVQSEHELVPYSITMICYNHTIKSTLILCVNLYRYCIQSIDQISCCSEYIILDVIGIETCKL